MVEMKDWLVVERMKEWDEFSTKFLKESGCDLIRETHTIMRNRLQDAKNTQFKHEACFYGIYTGDEYYSLSMINTIEAYRRPEPESDVDWIYGNSREGRKIENTLASSPIASPSPSDYFEPDTYIPSDESFGPIEEDGEERAAEEDFEDLELYLSSG
ncbi:hypothetical protein BGZ79_002024 [Entomortierella chlamydospora]|nr:hypothetical protein BGZ79_002024 [Entomortierella chlamydospora]